MSAGKRRREGSSARVEDDSDGMHGLWCLARGPFFAVTCSRGGHAWERYAVDRAGCTRCGVAHECEETLVDSHCPLVTLDDGAVACTVTGLQLRVVRYGREDGYSGEPLAAPVSAMTVREQARAGAGEAAGLVREHVERVVERFFSGTRGEGVRRADVERALEQVGGGAMRVLKQHKSESGAYPCLVRVVSETLGRTRARRHDALTPEMQERCVEGITRCIVNLMQHPSVGGCDGGGSGGGKGGGGLQLFFGARCDSVIVGMLYLMKQGLKVQNKEWLPRVHDLAFCLPHEGCLDWFPGFSMKIICETENMIKLALRQQTRAL